MAISNNESNNQLHPLVYHAFTNGYLQFSLVQPPFGYIVQLTPQIAFLICRNNSHNPNNIYGVHRPVIGLPGNYHCVGYARVRNFGLQPMRRDVMQVINLQLGRDVMQVMILKLEQLGRDGSPILDVADASPGITTRVQPLLDLNMPPPVQPLLDLNMPPPVEALDLNMPPVEEDEEQHTDHMATHVLEIHYHLVGVVRIDTTLEPVLNMVSSIFNPTYEEYLEHEEEMEEEVDSGLSEEAIMQHIHVTHCTATTRSPSEEPDICVICQAEYEDGESIGCIECGHEYHVQCIKKWLQRVNKCPLCTATAVHEHV